MKWRMFHCLCLMQRMLRPRRLIEIFIYDNQVNKTLPRISQISRKKNLLKIPPELEICGG
jgi:hypothetical protein